MTLDSRFEKMCTSYGRMVEVGRLALKPHRAADERVILDVPRQNPQYDNIWLAMSPDEARRLAGLLMRHADAAQAPVPAAVAGHSPKHQART